MVLVVVEVLADGLIVMIEVVVLVVVVVIRLVL